MYLFSTISKRPISCRAKAQVVVVASAHFYHLGGLTLSAIISCLLFDLT
jgi:hypothetical protein